MLLYGCFNIDIIGPLTQYLKTFPKFSRGAEVQPLRASRTLSFPQTRRFGVCSFNANEERGGSRRRVGPWPWAACSHGTMRSVYSGCIAIARRTQALAVFCKYFKTHGSPGALYLNNIILYIDIYIISYIFSHILSRRYWESQTTAHGFSDVPGSSTSTSMWSRLNRDNESRCRNTRDESPTCYAP